MHESLRPEEGVSGRDFKLFESVIQLIRVHESLRPNESENGRELKLLYSA